MGISYSKQKSCFEVIYWFCFPARGLVLIYFAASPEASSRLKCRHRMLGWTKYWQENAFGSFNWKNILLFHPEAKTLPQQHSAAQGGQAMCTRRRCSGSHLLRGFGGSTEAPTTATSSEIPLDPKSNSPGDSGASSCPGWGSWV